MVDMRLLVMEVEFGWVVGWWWVGGVAVCKNCVGLLLVLFGEVAYNFRPVGPLFLVEVEFPGVGWVGGMNSNNHVKPNSVELS